MTMDDEEYKLLILKENVYAIKWFLYLIVCAICSILIHFYSLYTVDVARSFLYWIIFLIPSLVASFFLKDLDENNLVLRKFRTPSSPYLSTIWGLILTVWPSWVIVECMRFVVSLYIL